MPPTSVNEASTKPTVRSFFIGYFILWFVAACIGYQLNGLWGAITVNMTGAVINLVGMVAMTGTGWAPWRD